MVRRLKEIPLYPFLIAIFPVLALLGHNISEIDPQQALRSIAFSLALCAGSLLFFHLFAKEPGRAALATGAGLIVFYSYGHVYRFFHGEEGLVGILGRHRHLLPLAIMVMLVATLLIQRVSHPRSQIPTLNTLGLLLLVYPTFQLVSYQVGREVARSKMVGRSPESELLELTLEDISGRLPEMTPDIYYIVLDAYGRSDALESHFGFDNSLFLNSLRELGFTIAGCSQSNYSSTILSIPSTLNMQYIDTLLGERGQATVPVMVELSNDNAIRRTLERIGYQSVSFESGYSVSEWENAEYYYDLPRTPLRWLRGLNEFESLLLDTSVLRVLRDVEGGTPIRLPTFLDYAYFRHRRQILNVLDHLPEIAENPAPTFTIAHVLAPHEPFVFDANGEHVTQSETFTLKPDILREDKPAYTRGYTNQIQFINKRVLAIVRGLLERSSQPPIIILQGDHGPKRNMSSNVARVAILNAYYLPGADPNSVYPSISPVNTFRLLLDIYFEADLPLLPDEAYLSSHADLLDFWPVGEIYWPCRDRLQ